MACARCHDHKYDADPARPTIIRFTAFSPAARPPWSCLSSTGPDKLPGCDDFEKKAAAKRAELRQFLDSQYAVLSETASQRVGDYLARGRDLSEPDPLETAIFFMSLAPEDLRPQMVARWRRYLKQRATRDDPGLRPLARPAGTRRRRLRRPRPAQSWQTGRPRPAGTKAGTGQPAGRGGPGQRLAQDQGRRAPRLWRADPARLRGITKLSSPATAARPTDAEKAARQILEIVTGHESPAYFPESQTYAYMSRGEKDAFGGKLVELDRMAVKAADKAAPRAMVLTDAAEPYEPRIFVRGNPGQPGDRVPRQFSPRSGRRQSLAVHPRQRPARPGAAPSPPPDNPLTSRVIVNRVWMHHFGEPLVVDSQRLRHPQHARPLTPSCSTTWRPGSCSRAGRSRACIA